MSADRVVGAPPREGPERRTVAAAAGEQGAPPPEGPNAASPEQPAAEPSGANSGSASGATSAEPAEAAERSASADAPEPGVARPDKRAERPPAGRGHAEVAAGGGQAAGEPPAEPERELEHEAVEDAAARDQAEEIERELAALSEKAAKADEYLELAQRTRADFENYRKRAAREAAAAQERGVAKLARELLAAIDNLDRALAAAEAHGDDDGGPSAEACMQLLSGIRLVHADVLAALARVGIEPFSPIGERFDPQYHEAVAQQPREGAEPGTVIEVYQLGYKHRDEVLRPARVLVAA